MYILLYLSSNIDTNDLSIKKKNEQLAVPIKSGTLIALYKRSTFARLRFGV